MMESEGVSRRQLLARGSKLAAAASAAPYLIAPGVAMAAAGWGSSGWTTSDSRFPT